MTTTDRANLTRAQIDALQVELEALRDEVLADLGEHDLRHIRRVIRTARGSAILGRMLLMFGFDPLSWAIGAAALGNAKIIENMEIGHNIMHGQYDWTGDPALNSRHYEWDIVGVGNQWRHSHNVMHHFHTNILDKDRDFGYGGLLRLSRAQAWKPVHLLQPVTNAALGIMFQWGVGIYELEVDQLLSGQTSARSFKRRAAPFLRKAAHQLFKDYALFPALALWNAPRVLAGNLAANLIRNLWTYAIIFCGHFPPGTQTFGAEETEHETRGDWYIRQMSASANIEGGRLFNLMSGHLSFQIEHHLFPDLPAPRYADLAPRVRAIAEKYGLPYNTGSFPRQFAGVMLRIMRHSLPI